MLVHENAIVKIRKDMPLELAALIGCGVITGYGAVVNTAKVAPGETVVVIGCGGVGMAAINGAQIAGAGRVIAVDTNPAKLQLATKLGATDIVDPRNGDVVQQVRDLTTVACITRLKFWAARRPPSRLSLCWRLAAPPPLSA
jgi:S-(hydroxymethyl)glutathione dehydrogenase / alcohol dehydrogenase